MHNAILKETTICRLAVPYPIGADDLIELQNTVYRVFTNQSDVILPGSLLGNYSSLQAATQNGVGGCVTPACSPIHVTGRYVSFQKHI